MTELRLDILPVLDAKPRRFVFVIGGVAYETMEGLKSHIEVMPKDRVIVLDPGCMPAVAVMAFRRFRGRSTPPSG